MALFFGPPTPPDRVRPSPINPLPGPPGPSAMGTFSSPAAQAAWAKFYHIAMPPPPKPQAAVGGVPAGQFLGAPGSVKTPTAGPYPGFMTPAEMMEQAKQMADMSFAPVLQAAGDQQRMLHAQNMAQLQAIQQAYSLMGVDPKSALGVANYNKALAEAQSSESDFAGKLVDLVAQRGQAQAGYLSDLQKQQAGLYGDYQSAHKPQIHYWANGRITALDPSTGRIQEISPADAAAAGAAKVHGSLSTGLWHQDANGNVVVDREGTSGSEKSLHFDTIRGRRVSVDPVTGQVVRDYGPVATATSKPSNLQIKNITQNGKVHTVAIDPRTGDIKVDYGPAPSVTTANAKAAVTSPAAKRRGYKILSESSVPQSAPLRHANGAPVTLPELQTAWDAHKDNWVKLGAEGPNGIPGVILDLLKTKKGAVIARTLLGDVKLSPRNPQETYMAIIHAGVQPYDAWKIVRSKFPKFGPDYFPKGNPAAKTAGEMAARGGGVNPAPLDAGKIIGYPYQGSHTLYGNWQSDNAVDFSVPVGTPIYAVADGKVGDRIGPLPGNDPHLSGLRVNLAAGDGNAYYYAHLSKLAVQAGQTVHKGDLLGYSGSANGVAHLHFAVEHGKPQTYFQPREAVTLSAKVPADSKPSPSLAQKYAYELARSKYKWSSADIASLRQLWQKESGWNYKAKNSGSGAAGIPQALGHELPPGYENDPQVQIRWGLNYIKERYGTPTRAWAFWRATVNRNANVAPPDLRGAALQWIQKGYQGY